MTILTAAQMAQADKLAIAGGISEIDLIRAAGKQLATKIIELSLAPHSKIVACCGNGNNGADAYICAGHLLRAGYEVHIISLPAQQEPMQAARETLQLLPPNAIHPNPQDPSAIFAGRIRHY